MRRNRQRRNSKKKKKKKDFLSWFAPYLRLKENTVSNLPNTNVAEINSNDDGMTKAEDNFSDCSEKSLFSSVSTNKSFETPWQRHCKVEKPKEKVKQAPEKPSKGLEIMEDIKSLQSKIISKIYPLRRKFEINNLLFKYQEDGDAVAVPQ